jgi:hypothetical protein
VRELLFSILLVNPIVTALRNYLAFRLQALKSYVRVVQHQVFHLNYLELQISILQVEHSATVQDFVPLEFGIFEMDFTLRIK